MKNCCDRHSGEGRNPEILVRTELDPGLRRGDDYRYGRHSGEGRNPETLSLNPWTPAFAGVTMRGEEVEP